MEAKDLDMERVISVVAGLLDALDVACPKLSGEAAAGMDSRESEYGGGIPEAYKAGLDLWSELDGAASVEDMEAELAELEARGLVPGTAAYTAALMATACPVDGDPDFWDRWKDDMKEGRL